MIHLSCSSKIWTLSSIETSLYSFCSASRTIKLIPWNFMKSTVEWFVRNGKYHFYFKKSANWINIKVKIFEFQKRRISKTTVILWFVRISGWLPQRKWFLAEVGHDFNHFWWKRVRWHEFMCSPLKFISFWSLTRVACLQSSISKEAPSSWFSELYSCF